MRSASVIGNVVAKAGEKFRKPKLNVGNTSLSGMAFVYVSYSTNR